MVRPSKFPPEFRVRGVQMRRESAGRTVTDVANGLGIATETFRK
jgi:transposase-like protein